MSIKSLIKEILYNSLAQAVLKIIWTPHLILRAFLIICVLISSCLSSYLVVQSFINYFDYEVITVSRTITEASSIFPKVTICMQSPFITKNSIDFLKEINQKVNPNIDIFDYDQIKNLSFANKSALIDDIIELAILTMLSKNFTNEQRKNFGHKLDDILIKCNFNGIACSSANFTWKFDRFYGNCFVFNSGENSLELKKSYLSGSFYGLNILIYSNFHENLTLINSNFRGRGVYVRFENSSYLSDDSFDNGVNILPGQSTSCSLRRLFKFNLAKPYSSCVLEHDYNYDIVDLIAKSPYAYTQRLCIYQCMQKQLIKECNCIDSNQLSLFQDQEPCASKAQRICFDRFLSNYISKNNSLRIKCLKLCPLECNSTEFTVSLSSYALIGDSLVDYINENQNLKNYFNNKSINSHGAKESFINLIVFYESLSYRLLNEYPEMNVVSLLASIGGNLSLFLGINLFSLFEVIDLFIEIYFIKKKNFLA